MPTCPPASTDRAAADAAPMPVIALREADAAAAIGLSPATLRAYRRDGCGPAYSRIGRAVVYQVSDLEKYVATRRQGGAA